MSAIGKNIKKFRLEKKLTQKKLGELCYPPIAESTIRRYELGKLNPTFETIQKIAHALDVHPLLLSGEITEKHAKTLELIEDEDAFNDVLKLINSVYNYAQIKKVSCDGLPPNYAASYILLGEDYDEKDVIALPYYKIGPITHEVITALIHSIGKYAKSKEEVIEELTQESLEFYNFMESSDYQNGTPDQSNDGSDQTEPQDTKPTK